MPSCSIIIPCYNEESHLGNCLDSLLTQTLSDVEVIVVDDGSTDKSVSVAQSFGVKVVSGQHRGPGIARNHGVQLASSHIVVFADADMTFHHCYLERLISPIQSGKAQGTFHPIEFVANPHNPWAACWTIQEGCPPGYRMRPDHPDQSPVFRAILREEFLRVGGYDDTGYGEDTTISKKLNYLAKEAPGAICFHNNPDSLAEVYTSARWIGRGNHTPQTLAYVLRRTPPVSLWRGLKSAIRHRNFQLVPFRLCYDAGLLAGVCSQRGGRSHVK